MKTELSKRLSKELTYVPYKEIGQNDKIFSLYLNMELINFGNIITNEIIDLSDKEEHRNN